MTVARFTTRAAQWRRKRRDIDASLAAIDQQVAAVRRMLRGFDTTLECEEEYGAHGHGDQRLSSLGITTWLDEVARALTAARQALPPTLGYDKP